jgi:hypothetical protein
LSLTWGRAFAATPVDAIPPHFDAVAQKKGEEKKTAEEKSEEQKRAEEEAERKRKEKLARVIVLKVKDTSTDYTNEAVHRNVRSRISRPEAMFFPEVDLYQSGRKVPDRTVIPAMQPAIVPDSNIPVILAEVNKVAALGWRDLQPSEWGLKADELRRMAELIWFVDRVELREPLFLLYAQIGKAAENQNHPAPPFYEQVGNYAVNYYWYKAAQLAYQEPALMSKLTDQDVSGGINYLLQQLQKGEYPSFKVDFEQEDYYDAELFNKTYEVRVNGIPVEPDSNGQYDVFLGRTDIYFKRKDTGHGLSERLELLKLEDKVYFVRNVAQKVMGIEFIDQLFLHKNECTPEVDGNILNYLAIYQKLHDKAEVYVAVAEDGNPNKVWIWRYDRNKASLSMVGGGPDNFPVRFALVFSSGILYNGGYVAADTEFDEGDGSGDENASDPTQDIGVNAGLEPAAVPFSLELRAHYNRLMVNFGVEYGLEASKDGEGWVEYYQHHKPRRQLDGNIEGLDENDVGSYVLTNCTEPLDTDGDGDIDQPSSCNVEEILKYRDFSRDIYLGAGVVLGRDAGIGFGPRFAFRWGWINIPHGFTTTAHFGWAVQPPIGEFGKRFRPLLDFDLRGGVAIPMDRSLQLDIVDPDSSEPERRVSPMVGLNLGLGFTF